MPVLFLLFSLRALILTYQQDPDLGWHLYLGNYASSHHTLVTTLVGYNVFQSKTLIDHEWLADLGMNWIYAHIGYAGLLWLAYILGVITLWLVYRSALTRGSSKTAAVLAGTIFLVGYSLVFNARVQLLLPLGVAMLLLIGRSKFNWPLRCLLYFLVFLVGNNLHGGFVVLMAVPVIWELVGRKRGGIMCVCAIGLALAINPYGMAFVNLMKDYVTDSSYRIFIQEWHPLFFPDIEPLFGAIPFMLTAFLLLAASFWQRSKPHEWLLLAFFMFLSLRYARFLPCFLVVAAPYLAESCDKILKLYKEHAKLATYGFIGLTALMFILTLNWHEVTVRPNSMRPAGYPAAAMAVMSNYPDCQNHLFNPYGWGGYIVGFYSGTKVFIDGRGPQLSVRPGQTLIQLYNSILNGSAEQTGRLLDQYDLRCVLIDKTEDNAMEKIVQAPQWQKIFENNSSIIYVRK